MKNLLIVFFAFSQVGFARHETVIRRYALLISREDGGRSNPKLRYSQSDAKSLAKVLHEVGGVNGSEMSVAYNPSRAELATRFQLMKQLIQRRKAMKERSELVFYYSGHSDESGILLGSERLTYHDLKKSIQALNADVSMLVLDSCASGSLTRLKGGVKVAPFLTESLSNLKGFVALTSSSNDEASQESDKLGASYFTHYLISGLRGAADINSDNKVTLNEAYQYAYQQTLARTEKTIAGPQHPSYTIQLSGQGELVMTDLRKVSARLLLDAPIQGRIFIRDRSEKIIAEVAKSQIKPLILGLEPGLYTLLLSQEGDLRSAKVVVAENATQSVKLSDFKALDLESAEKKGGVFEERDFLKVGAEFSVVPGVSTNHYPPASTINNFHLSIFYMTPAQIRGFGWSMLGTSIAKDSVEGMQSSFIFNDSKKYVTGLQFSTFGNRTGTLTGAQFSAGYNATQDLTGLQIGVWNEVNKAGKGVQIGVSNFESGMTQSLQIGALNLSQTPEKLASQWGAVNFSKSVQGAQGGGLNYAEDTKGFQVGAASYSKKIVGAQVSGFNLSKEAVGVQAGAVNYASKIEGAQIGAINLAKEAHGIQIGFFNYGAEPDAFTLGLINISKQSPFRVAYHFDEMSHHLLAFKSGTRLSYTFLEVGVKDFSSEFIEHTEAFGLGIELPLASILSMGLEVSLTRLDVGDFSENGLYYAEARLFPRVSVTSWLDLFAGISVKKDYTLGLADETPIRERPRIGYIAGLEFKL